MLLLKMTGKKEYSLYKQKEDQTEEKLVDLKLIQHSMSNKFEIVGDILEDMCTNIEGFEDWYENLVREYIRQNYNAEILLESSENFFLYADKYLEHKAVRFEDFVNMDKKSKTSIVFYPEDIRTISLCSTCLKLYSLFFCDTKMKLPDNTHRHMYESLIKPCIDSDVTTKIFQLIRSRTYKSSITDKYMWEFIKMMISETPESYVMTVFNFLMKSILILVDVKQNPVPFLISTIDDSIRWLMRSVYKDKIIYGEVFGGVEDMYGASLTKENFYLYCCQDVIGKSAKAGINILEDKYNLNDEEFDKVTSRLDSITYLYPASLLVTLPIVSKVLEIPYKFLLTIPPKHAMLLGLFMYEIGQDILDERFPIVSEFLISCPKNQNVMATKSSYKMRNLELILNDSGPIFGFKSKFLKFEIMSSITGVLSASKKNLVSLINGKQLSKMTYFSLENDVCTFFSELYANQCEKMFDQMRERADGYF